MKNLPVFLILAGAFAVPVFAETYGEEISAVPEAPSRIKTVPRTPLATMPTTNALAKDLAKPVEPSGVDARSWHLSAGHLVRQDLTSWGERSGWQVLWHLPRDWTVPADTDFEGDFKEAAAAVIRTLADNGLVIRGQFYDGNRTLVVKGAGPVIPDPQ